MNRQNDLTTEKIPVLIRRIAVPASIGFFFNTMFNVVDTYWAGRYSTDALAALSLSFPVFFILLAIAQGIAIGTTALMANAFGAGDQKLARTYYAQGISFGAIASVFITLAGLLISPALFRNLGADGAYLAYSVGYMNVILYGVIFFMMTFMLNNILNATGDTRTFRNLLIIAFFLNVFLDPALMYGWAFLPALGVAGVAWATVAIQALMSAVLLAKVVRAGYLQSSLRCIICPRIKYFKDIAMQGIPAGLNFMTIALGTFIIVYFVSKFGKEAVAGYTTAARIEQMAILPNIGLNIATLTLAGQNFGARLHGRTREVLKTALRYTFISISAGMVALLFFGPALMHIFSDDKAVILAGAGYLRVAAFILYGYGVLYIVGSFLQGLKKPMFAFWIGLYRQIAGPLLLFPLLYNHLGLGLAGIWTGIFILVWTSVLIAWLYVGRVLKATLA